MKGVEGGPWNVETRKECGDKRWPRNCGRNWETEKEENIWRRAMNLRASSSMESRVAEEGEGMRGFLRLIFGGRQEGCLMNVALEGEHLENN